MTTVNYPNPGTDPTVRVFDDLLNELANQSTIQITATLAYYLNNQRSNTTLLGITTVPTPNQYTARNILI
jgi:hypothetical protein